MTAQINAKALRGGFDKLREAEKALEEGHRLRDAAVIEMAADLADEAARLIRSGVVAPADAGDEDQAPAAPAGRGRKGSKAGAEA